MKNNLTRRQILKAGTGAAAVAATTNIFTARRSLAQRSKKIVFWLQPNFNPVADKTMESQIYEFAKSAGIKRNEVTILKVAGGEISKKMSAALEVGAPPDVTRVNESNFMQWHDAGQLLDISDVVGKMKTFEGGVNQNALTLVEDGGRYFAAPMGLNPQVLHARMDKLDEAGYNDMPATQDEFVEACIKITKPPFYANGMALGLFPNDSGWSIMQVGWPLGARLITEDGRPAVGSEAMVKTFERIRWMRNDLKIIPKGTISWNNSGNNKAYQSGQVAFANNPTSIYSSLFKNKSPLFEKTGLFAAPGGPDGRHEGLYTDYYGVFSKSPYPEIAKGLVAYLMEPKNYNAFIVAAGGRYTPVYPKLTEDPFWKSNPKFNGLIEVARKGHTYFYPGKLNLGLAEFTTQVFLTKGLHRVLVDGESPQAAVEWTNQRMVEIFKRHNLPV